MQSKDINFIHLDFIRGIAALLVMFGHLRAYLFVSPDQLINPGFVDKIFYFVTGFGRESVIVFFVLSGFFITKSIVGLIERDHWSWHYYLIRRLSRLWTVLVPALLLTLFWDSLGQNITDSGYYAGEYSSTYNRGPSPADGGVSLTFGTFIQNLLFLHTITSPIFGSNLPLWSLANEFWYYILFPLVLIPIVTKQRVLYKMSSFCLFLTIVYQLPLGMVMLGLVWLNGSLSYWLLHKNVLSRIFRYPLVMVLSLAILIITLSAVRVGLVQEGLLGDLFIGIATSVFILSITRFNTNLKFYKIVSEFISKISYTLYAVHDPILAFIACFFLFNIQAQFTTSSVMLFVGLSAAMVVYGSLVYWIFERNTGHVNRKVLQLTGYTQKK